MYSHLTTGICCFEAHISKGNYVSKRVPEILVAYDKTDNTETPNTECVKVKKPWNYNSTSPYDIMTRCLVKHRKLCAFYLYH
jgi:hypothetical protein